MGLFNGAYRGICSLLSMSRSLSKTSTRNYSATPSSRRLIYHPGKFPPRDPQGAAISTAIVLTASGYCFWLMYSEYRQRQNAIQQAQQGEKTELIANSTESTSTQTCVNEETDDLMRTVMYCLGSGE